MSAVDHACLFAGLLLRQRYHSEVVLEDASGKTTVHNNHVSHACGYFLQEVKNESVALHYNGASVGAQKFVREMTVKKYPAEPESQDRDWETDLVDDDEIKLVTSE